MELKNKVALVTGGSEGLGLSIAKVLIKEDCKVHILSRNQKKTRKSTN